MKLFEPDPEDVPPPPPPRPQRRRGPKKPRCRCGCGRAAEWPQDDPDPVFYSRLCGYLMALKMFRRKAR